MTMINTQLFLINRIAPNANARIISSKLPKNIFSKAGTTLWSSNHSAEAGIAVKHKANIDKRINILGNISNIKIMKNNMSITVKTIRAITLLLAIFSMSACSTYPNKFKCGDAKGLGCTMLAEVDRQIDNGKIEEVYQDKKCKRGHCKTSNTNLALNNKDVATLYEETFEEPETNDNNLYF